MMEKFYSSKTLLKLADGGNASPTSATEEGLFEKYLAPYRNISARKKQISAYNSEASGEQSTWLVKACTLQVSKRVLE